MKTSSTALFVLLLAALSSALRSDVWCHGDHQDHRHCSFKNICYSNFHQNFIFFYSASASDVSGLSDFRRLVRLTAVEGRDDFYLDLAVFPEDAFAGFNVVRVDDPVLIIKRWNPDNLLHVVHDDLMPIFETMRHLCFGDASDCYRRFRLAFQNGNGSGKYDELYEMLHRDPLIFLDKEAPKGEKQLLCFTKAIVGLDDASLWYDHGLERGQGPLMPEMWPRSERLEDFRGIVLKKLAHLHSPHKLEYPNVVVVLNTNDQILNLDDLIDFVVKSRPDINYDEAKVSILSIAEHSPDHIFRTVSKAKVMIAPHGSENVVGALFLDKKFNPMVVEVFPYGLDSQSFAFTRTMAAIRGLHYEAIETSEASRSIGYPNRAPKDGGIRHLNPDTRSAIEAMANVGSVNYDDPAYLYHMNKATRVDLSKVAFNSHVDGDEHVEDLDWVIPAKASNFQCKIHFDGENPHVDVSWRPPMNLDYVKGFKNGNVVYEVLAQSEEADVVHEASTKETQISVSEINLKRVRLLKIWVSARVDNEIRGQESFFMCDLENVFTG